MAKRITHREQRRTAVANAMPDVKKVVKKHGLSVVGSCIAKMRDYSRELKRLEKLEAEVAERKAKLL